MESLIISLWSAAGHVLLAESMKTSVEDPCQGKIKASTRIRLTVPFISYTKTIGICQYSSFVCKAALINGVNIKNVYID